MKKILCAMALLGPAIWAQDFKPMDIKPGLWENTTTSQISGLQMPAGNMPQLTPQQMAQMPPDARARYESMMKGGPGAPQTNTTKSCITSADLVKPLTSYMDKSCTMKMVSSSSTSQQIHVECTRGNTKTAGDLTFNRTDSEHLTGTMLMKASGDATASGAAANQNMTIKLSFSNKFLSSDCGDVKPSSAGK